MEEPVMRRLRSTETVFKLCLLVFILFLVWTSRSYPEKSRLFPQLLGSVTAILILVSFVQALIGPRRAVREEETGVPETPPASVREEKLKLVKELEEKGEADAGYELLEKSLRRKRLVQSVIVILISLGIGYLGGFLLTVPFYFIVFGLLHGQKKYAFRYVVIAISITAVIYLFFTYLMGVPLLRGIWWG
jgi:hypothetical protein